MKKKLVVFSGAGISAESGVKTFRDSDGLWENHRVEDVASPEGFEKNPKMVLDFYNARRRQLNEIEPNKAHFILAELEKYFDVQIITQNVDDLHERAGSGNSITSAYCLVWRDGARNGESHGSVRSGRSFFSDWNIDECLSSCRFN